VATTRDVAGTHVGVTPKQVSRSNKGAEEFAAEGSGTTCGARFVAEELKITKRPSGLIPGEKLGPLASPPSGAIEMRMVLGTHTEAAPMQVSRRKMSLQPFASPFTRLLASDAKATNRPSLVTEGALLGPFGPAPFHPMDTGID